MVIQPVRQFFTRNASPSLVPSARVNPLQWASARRHLSAEVETREFQAETRKLLDIVTNSIYTDKEVFIRELISNASDALEKYRYNQVKGTVIPAAINTQPEISLFVNTAENTLTIMDSGIGMSKEELIANLGTIARSGSKAFVEEVRGKGEGSANAEGIIGQFGVGFYASFMVAEQVTVESLSALTEHNKDNIPHRWGSDGYGVFSIESIPSVAVPNSESTLLHGTKITLKLKESAKEFADPERLRSIIKRYSNFVSFPIKVNGEVVNTVPALWTQSPSQVTDEQYDEFFKFVSHQYDKYTYKLHFKTDAPLDLKTLFYVPKHHSEKYGMGRMEPGVNLYSRKVLIESKPKDLLPDWMRFVKGVVDSEDLPLSLSREKPQDSQLLRRIRDVLVRKLLRFLSDEQKNHPDTFKSFYEEYHMFLKEGLCSDAKYMELLSKLLLYETSETEPGTLSSFDEYIARCPPEQKEVYYLVAPSRSAALASPYFETFRKHGKEVLLLYNSIDEFVMTNLKAYAGRNLVSAEASTIDFGEEKEKKDEEKGKEEEKDKEESGRLTEAEAKDLCDYLSLVLGSKVRTVKVTHRLSSSPAIVTDHESGSLRRMMRLVEQANAGKGIEASELPPQQLEINPSHPLIVQLYAMKDRAPKTADLVAQQLFDNTLVAAGLVDDARSMLSRLQELLIQTLKHADK